MMHERLSIDADAGARLIRAVIQGGSAAVQRIIQVARKHRRGIADMPVAAWPLPVSGHLKGSTIGKPRLSPADDVDPAARLASIRA